MGRHCGEGSVIAYYIIFGFYCKQSSFTWIATPRCWKSFYIFRLGRRYVQLFRNALTLKKAKPFIKLKQVPWVRGGGHIYKYFSILDTAEGSVLLSSIFLRFIEWLLFIKNIKLRSRRKVAVVMNLKCVFQCFYAG